MACPPEKTETNRERFVSLPLSARIYKFSHINALELAARAFQKCSQKCSQKVKRWYDCDVVYEDDRLKDLHYSGAVEKDRPVSYLLGMIEEVTDVGFEIEGNEIRMFWKR